MPLSTRTRRICGGWWSPGSGIGGRQGRRPCLSIALSAGQSQLFGGVRVGAQPAVELVAAKEQPAVLLVVGDGALRGELVEALFGPVEISGCLLDAEPGRMVVALAPEELGPQLLGDAFGDLVAKLVEQ